MTTRSRWFRRNAPPRRRSLSSFLLLTESVVVMPGLDPGIYLFKRGDGIAGRRQAEATPFFAQASGSDAVL